MGYLLEHCHFDRLTSETLTRFLVRMYENAPFEGVKVVDDYDHRFLLSVLLLSK